MRDEKITSAFTHVLQVHTSTIASYDLTTILMQNESDSRTYFSIAAMLHPLLDPENDICIVSDITNDPEYAAELFERICQGTVTPCTLRDVLSDLL